MTTCNEFRRSLEMLLDGELPPGEASSVEKHISSCLSCAEQLEQLEPPLEGSAFLEREEMPARDLWPAIESKIGTSSRGADSGFRWRPVLAMAAAVVAAIGLVVFSVYREIGVNENNQLLGPVRYASNDSTTTDSHGTTYASIKAEMENLRAQLLDVMEARGDEISPATRRVVLDNLELIDDAIARIVGALEEDPNSPELNRLLLAAYESELGILRQISRLPAAS